MLYKPHQVEKSIEVYARLKKYGIAYLFGQPRSGKTRTAIHTVENSQVRRVLVLTPKAAISGWMSELKAVGAVKKYTVINYEQVKNLKDYNYQLVIVDEAHRLGKVGKPTQRVKEIGAAAFNLPVLYLSGTPIVETPLSIYYQFSITRYSPLQFKSFYRFFDEYGIPSPIKLHGRWVEQYKKHKPELLDVIEPYIVRMTQQEAGIDIQATDKLHTVQLLASTKQLIEKIREDNVIELNGEQVAFESDMAVRLAEHQVEYGALKVDDQYIDLPNREVIDYLLATWGDTPDLALMCHYKSTRDKLKKHFKNAQIFSSTAHAEGVSLAHFKHFVIVGTCFSGAKHIQRRERGINMNKTDGSTVHMIVTDDGISQAVYDAVSKKRDFNLRMYRNERVSHTKTNKRLA